VASKLSLCGTPRQTEKPESAINTLLTMLFRNPLTVVPYGDAMFLEIPGRSGTECHGKDMCDGAEK
jgi:hypothetical protein